MTGALEILRIGPGASLQDLGRPGMLRMGLSKGGAADPLAHFEGAAILGQPLDLASLEMPAMGGQFRASRDIRFALTGAPMAAKIGSNPAQNNASHLLRAGEILTIGAATSGVYGYLHVGGGLSLGRTLGAISAHIGAGLGRYLNAGEMVPIGEDTGHSVGQKLSVVPRFSGGPVRVLPSAQTHLFEAEVKARFERTTFTRDARANRMGVRMKPDGPGFANAEGLRILSEIILPGDIQMTGDGAPYILMAECQTTGGYPRIGQVIGCDLPIVAQAPAGAKVTFEFVTRADGFRLERAHAAHCSALPTLLEPLVRDPADVRDLLSYQLISGVVSSDD